MATLSVCIEPFLPVLPLTLPLPSLLVPTRLGGSAGPPCYLKNSCPHDHEILYGIRDIFERPRNFKVSYILINWLPSNSSNTMCFISEIARFNPKMGIALLLLQKYKIRMGEDARFWEEQVEK